MSLSHDCVDDQNSAPMEKAAENTTPIDDVTMDEALVGVVLQDEDAAKIFTRIAATLWGELEKAEKKSLDVSEAVDQIVKMSDRDQYRRAMDAIFSDPSLSTAEKLRFKAEEDERQNRKDDRAADRVIRLQNSQSDVIMHILTYHWRDICLSTGCILLFGTKKGRACLSKAVDWTVKEAPRLVRALAA